MDRMISDLLNDTLNVVQLARQASLACGNADRAGKLSSIAEGLHKVVSNANSNPSSSSTAQDQAFDDDKFLIFQKSIESKQHPGRNNASTSFYNSTISNVERASMVMAMVSGGMDEMGIARQLGMTRDEIRGLLSLNQPATSQGRATSGVMV